MRSLSLLIFASLCHLSFQTQLRTQTDGFRSPGYIGNRKANPLAAVEVWKVGEPRIVAFDAPWTEYDVKLYQSVGADHANRTSGKIVYQQLLGQNLPRNFNWTVDSYDLKLSDSNMFFFWLQDPSDAARSVTSPYFNMTTDASAATPNTFFSYGGIEDSSGDPPIPPARSTPSPPPAATPTHSAAAQANGGISLAVQVGIGVGISVGGICSFVCAVIVGMHLRKKINLQRSAKELDEESVSSLPWPPTPKLGASEVWGLPKPPPSSFSLDKQPNPLSLDKKVELPMGRVQEPLHSPSPFLANKKTSRYELDGKPRVTSSVYSR